GARGGVEQQFPALRPESEYGRGGVGRDEAGEGKSDGVSRSRAAVAGGADGDAGQRVIHWKYGVSMIKKLTKHGNSFALVIDRPILDLLKIDPESPLDVTTDGARLIVAAAKPSER